MRSKLTWPSIKETCFHHSSMTKPSGYRGQGGRLRNCFSQWGCRFLSVPACQQMSQSYSPCTFSAFSHPHFIAAYGCSDISEIGLCEVKFLQQKFQEWNALCALHTCVLGYGKRAKPWVPWHCASIKCRFVHLRLPVVGLRRSNRKIFFLCGCISSALMRQWEVSRCRQASELILKSSSDLGVRSRWLGAFLLLYIAEAPLLHFPL